MRRSMRLKTVRDAIMQSDRELYEQIVEKLAEI